MHIPDGFLSIPVSATTTVISIGGLIAALRNIRKKFSDRMIPTMGVLAAFIFAAQMFNFPVAGGTSGHLMGGVLASAVVGPMAASVVMTVVLIVQCLLFQDGGIVALGANIFNMAIVGCWVGWAVYFSIWKIGRGKLLQSVGIFIGAWISVVAAATCCAFELTLSGTVPLFVGLPAMVGIHAIIGIGEGIITMIVVSFIKKVKPEIICG